MTEILTAAQMRAIEKATIDSGEVTGLVLMGRAGAGVVAAIMEEWPDLAQSSYKAVVLCGPGNNGGDGFVIARLLKQRGWEVEVFLYGDPEKLPPDAKVNYERWGEMGEVSDFSSAIEPSMCKASIVIDALFGTGLTRPIEDENLRYTLLDICDCFDAGGGLPVGVRPDWAPAVVAVDIPTGLCADSGRVLIPEDYESRKGRLESSHVVADLTVSFHSMKLGHVLADGPKVCGKTLVVDIGLAKKPLGAARLTAPNSLRLKK